MPHRRIYTSICLAVLSAVAVVAQQTGGEALATFSSSTELVLVPTIVTDKSGTHIQGLKKEAFELSQDGKVQSLSVFEEVMTDAQRYRRATGENGQFSNIDPAGEGHHRRQAFGYLGVRLVCTHEISGAGRGHRRADLLVSP